MGLVSLIPMTCVFLLSLYFRPSTTNPHSFLSLLYLIYQTHFHSFAYSSLSYLCITCLILAAIASRVAHYRAIVVSSAYHRLGTFLDSHSHMTRTLVV